MSEHGTLQPVVAGAVAALVGFASTFALVLAGLRAVGADEAQAASGLLTLCVAMGVTAIALAAPDAHPDPRRRWVASVSAGAAYLVLGLLAGVVTALVAGSPPILIEAVAGLALLGALGAALTAAAEDAARREAVTITFAVSASAITVAGINAPFWGLVAGLAFLVLQRTAPAARPAPEAA